jgi:hypothetical protein
LQQSVATPHELPEPLQVPTEEPHVCATGSQACEQHCASVLHVAPATVQMTPLPPPPPPPAPVLIALTVLLPHPANATAMAATASVK